MALLANSGGISALRPRRCVKVGETLASISSGEMGVGSNTKGSGDAASQAFERGANLLVDVIGIVPVVGWGMDKGLEGFCKQY